jgi:hypothetical protein
LGQNKWGIGVPGGFFLEEKHLYRNLMGTPVPSSTGVFEILGLSDFSMVKPEVLEWKRTYGTAVHKASEYLAYKRLDWDTVDPAIVAPVSGIEQFFLSINYVPLAAEEIKVHILNGMQFGMRLDHRGTCTYHGVERPVVIDIKTGSKYSPTWEWQVGSYVAGSPKLNSGTYLGLVLQVGKDGDVEPFWVDVIKRQREFVVLLASANLIVNEGLKKIKGCEED